MSQPDYKLRTTKHIAASLADTHQALNNAARIMATGQDNGAYPAASQQRSPLDVLDYKHWSINSLDFGFNARQIDAYNTSIDLSLNVYFSKLPLARSAFEMLVQPQLLQVMGRFGMLSQILANKGNARNLATRVEQNYPIAA